MLHKPDTTHDIYNAAPQADNNDNILLKTSRNKFLIQPVGYNKHCMSVLHCWYDTFKTHSKIPCERWEGGRDGERKKGRRKGWKEQHERKGDRDR